MSKKTVFISFANSDFAMTLERLKKQMLSCKDLPFTEYHFFTEKDLDRDFMRKLKPWLYRRGFGYWRWKSHLVDKVLSTLTDGDILVYADAGCDFNAKGLPRLMQYIDMAKASTSGIVCFSDRYKEYMYTKSSTAAYLQALQSTEIMQTNQFFGGGFILVKGEISTLLVHRWKETCLLRPDLITDQVSDIPNHPSFIEHRHDQSVLSILAKQLGVEALPPGEISKENFENIPFCPSRHKEKDRKTQLVRHLLLPLRYLIGLYLKYFKHFYFHGRIAW